jgi:hypothetical protein
VIIRTPRPFGGVHSSPGVLMINALAGSLCGLVSLMH